MHSLSWPIQVSKFFRWVFCLCLLLSLVAASTAALANETSQGFDGTRVIDIGNRRQVFIDRRFIATSRNVDLVVHPPQKTYEHTIRPEQPWEPYLGSHISVLKLDGTYHMWYSVSGALCYARSKDGILYEKPNLGLADYKGSRENNIVVGYGAGGIDSCGHGGMVFLDPKAPKDQQLRMAMTAAGPNHIKILSSPDGIHWKLTHDKVVSYTEQGKRHHLDSQNVIFYDDRINKYVAYMRRNTYSGGSVGRSIARSESDHLGGFLETQVAPIVIGHDNLDVSIGSQAHVDYYHSVAIKYPWAQDAYYMFPQAYFHYTPRLYEFKEGYPINSGPIHSQFAASRDGIEWERFDRRPFVKLGMKGTFDSMSARVGRGVVSSLDGRQMYMYYYASDKTHGWGRKNSDNNDLLTKAGVNPQMDIGVYSRLVLRRDGFVSAKAAYAGGEFTTPLLTFEGSELVINVDTSAVGIVQCELLNRDGIPIEGYSLDDCDRIHTANEINRVVKWKGVSDVGKLAGKPIRLRFVYRDADLYAFQFRRTESGS